MPAYYDEKSKTWYVTFYFTDWTGVRKKKLKRGFKRKKYALDFEREFTVTKSTQCDMTFNSLYEIYMADLGTRLKPTTVATKKAIFELKILPYFKNTPINEISAAHIRQWQNELMSKNDFAPTYLKMIHSQFSAIMNYAIRFYDLPSNPCVKAGSIGKKNADNMKFWTLKEFNQFIAVETSPRAKLAFEVLFWTGIRLGELLALTPADISPTKEMTINKNLAVHEGMELILSAKTETSARIIPLPDFLYENIQSYLSKIYGIAKTDRIFLFSKYFLKKEMQRCCKLAGVKEIRTHDLRHSHVALLINMGYDIMVIAQRLGHNRVETTWNTYGHLYPDEHKKLAENLNTIHTDNL